MQPIFLVAGHAADVFIGLVFLVAGIDKLRHRNLLPGVIANYRLLPDWLVPAAAMLLPPVELLVGVALLLGAGPAAMLAAIALLLAFAGAMVINIGRGRLHIDCGCGHAGLKQTLGWPLVGRNLLMALAVGLSLLSATWFPAGAGTAELAMGAVSGLVLFLLMLTFNALNALPGRTPDGVRG